ncbi:hypothetical protein GCM10010124_29650 [Pilimelia terevasa]|uniref:Class E sortase n=1 Tax=Pilimelia terevasa TaxID=53372 RepID=A0A8J3FIV0_9ACTN|nr:class E sortase [Pilimelia terevasa]GGK35056.1 hypothetical protein GCM10010124_29650 [Pilimelia terevasa]
MTEEFDVDLDAGREREDRRARSRERRARRGRETRPDTPASPPPADRPAWDGPTALAPTTGAPAPPPPGPTPLPGPAALPPHPVAELPGAAGPPAPPAAPPNLTRPDPHHSPPVAMPPAALPPVAMPPAALPPVAVPPAEVPPIAVPPAAAPAVERPVFGAAGAGAAPTDSDPTGAIHAVAGTESVDAPYGAWASGPAVTPPPPGTGAGGGRHRVDTTAEQPGMPRRIAEVPRPATVGGPGTARGTAAVPAVPPTGVVPPSPPPSPPPAPAGGPGADPPAPRRGGRVTAGGVVRGTVRGFGELMITCGVVLLLFAGYEIYGKTAIVDAAQGDLDRAFDKTPAAASANRPSTGKPPPGDAVARLHIPRLAKKWVVVEGVAPDDIKVAPGHYPKSAMPGQSGNFSVAGHRVKSTFWDLDDMRPGDPIVVETKTNWYVYRTSRSRIVRPTAVEVVDPVPPGFRSGERLLTITTCNPKWDNYERLVVHASLLRTQPRSAGDPAELRR